MRNTRIHQVLRKYWPKISIIRNKSHYAITGYCKRWGSGTVTDCKHIIVISVWFHRECLRTRVRTYDRCDSHTVKFLYNTCCRFWVITDIFNDNLQSPVSAYTVKIFVELWFGVFGYGSHFSAGFRGITGNLSKYAYLYNVVVSSSSHYWFIHHLHWIRYVAKCASIYIVMAIRVPCTVFDTPEIIVWCRQVACLIEIYRAYCTSVCCCDIDYCVSDCYRISWIGV